MRPDYCDSCTDPFKMMAACPDPAILHGPDLFQAILEYIWAYASLLPLFINIGQGVYLLGWRSSRTIFMAIAMVLHGWVNTHILKKAFAESRPADSCAPGYGLPSGHSGFAIGLAAWLILEMVLLHDKVPFKRGKGYKLMTILYLMVAPLIAISRVFLHYHSMKQIVWGAVTGIVMYSAWFLVMLMIVSKNEGRFWSELTRGLRQRKIIEENLLGYETANGEVLMSDHEKVPNQEEDDSENKELKVVLPLKEGIRKFVWKRGKNQGSKKTTMDPSEVI